MEAYVLIAIIVGGVAVWFIRASRPLNIFEISEFARRRRLLAIENNYSFTEGQATVNLNFKSSMDATGRLYHMDEAVNRFPSLAAGLLKSKKHEWIIFGFARGRRVIAAWMNKGPDNEKVWPVINHKTLVDIAKELNADTVLEFHNHPNPYPSRRIVFLPSHQDHKSATYLGAQFVTCGVNYFAFVTERGRHFQYACWVPTTYFPLNSFIVEIISQNGTSRLTNLRLRRQHRTHSRLASLLEYKDASTNFDFVLEQQSVQSARLSETSLTPQPSIQREPLTRPTNNSNLRPTLTLVPVESSNLLAVGYDETRQLLEVVFRNGTVYQYSGVPESEYKGLMSAPSKGKFFNARIVRGGYIFNQLA